MRRCVSTGAGVVVAAVCWVAADSYVAAQQGPRVAPVVRTISGSPLTIQIADDTSMQVSDENHPGLSGSPLFSTPFCLPGQTGTGDAGVFVSVAGLVYGPDFVSHPCGTFVTAPFTPWTPISIGPVTGSGTAADPFLVVVVADAGSSGLRLTETLTYIDGSTSIVPALSVANLGSSQLTWDTFLALGRMNLARPLRISGAPGVQDAVTLGAGFPACNGDAYFIFLPPSDRYSGNPAQQVWAEISSGNLSNTLYPGCPSDGLATEWTNRTLDAGNAVTLNPNGSVSFTSSMPQTIAPVPALSFGGATVLIVAVAVVGLIVLRGGSLGC